eukprot:8106894-Pyramimonas_sp.AAC.1
MMRERNVGSFVQAVDEVRSPLAAEHIAVVPVRRLGKIVKLFSRDIKRRKLSAHFLRGTVSSVPRMLQIKVPQRVGLVIQA